MKLKRYSKLSRNFYIPRLLHYWSGYFYINNLDSFSTIYSNYKFYSNYFLSSFSKFNHHYSTILNILYSGSYILYSFNTCNPAFDKLTFTPGRFNKRLKLLPFYTHFIHFRSNSTFTFPFITIFNRIYKGKVLFFNCFKGLLHNGAKYKNYCRANFLLHHRKSKIKHFHRKKKRLLFKYRYLKRVRFLKLQKVLYKFGRLTHRLGYRRYAILPPRSRFFTKGHWRIYKRFSRLVRRRNFWKSFNLMKISGIPLLDRPTSRLKLRWYKRWYIRFKLHTYLYLNIFLFNPNLPNRTKIDLWSCGFIHMLFSRLLKYRRILSMKVTRLKGKRYYNLFFNNFVKYYRKCFHYLPLNKRSNSILYKRFFYNRFFRKKSLKIYIRFNWNNFFFARHRILYKLRKFWWMRKLSRTFFKYQPYRYRRFSHVKNIRKWYSFKVIVDYRRYKYKCRLKPYVMRFRRFINYSYCTDFTLSHFFLVLYRLYYSIFIIPLSSYHYFTFSLHRYIVRDIKSFYKKRYYRYMRCRFFFRFARLTRKYRRRRYLRRRRRLKLSGSTLLKKSIFDITYYEQ